MKTQIITLEAHDDLISVRDRLSWAKTPRILLVWPKGERIALRPLDLKVLQRHADSLGAQLGIVTRIDPVRRMADALGLPVFESSAAAQRDSWPHPEKRRRRIIRPPRRDLHALRAESVQPEAAWRSSLPVRILAFFIGVLAVLALVGIFVPRALVTVYPEARSQDLVIPVSASPQITSVFVTGAVPAYEQRMVLSGGKAVNVSSRISVPQTTARGVARFRNLTQEEVTLPAGTIVYAAGERTLRFRTLGEARLAPGLEESEDVPIEALDAGREGNVEAGSILGIEGPLGLRAAVENPEPTGGGSNTTALGASELDRQKLLESLLEELRIEAETSFREGLPAGDILLTDTLTMSERMEEVFDPPVGRPGTRLSLNLYLDITVQTISAFDLESLADSALNASAPEGFSAVPDSLQIEQITTPVTTPDGTTGWEMKASRRILRNVDEAQVIAAVRGKPVREAHSALAGGFRWRDAPVIALTPPWWPLLPLLPFRIAVNTE